jgi:uncharacterized protein YnzC (UPF0291/DUF896 family)
MSSVRNDLNNAMHGTTMRERGYGTMSLVALYASWRGSRYIKGGKIPSELEGIPAWKLKYINEVMPYNKARKITAGERGVIQAHHIIERRHLKRWRLDINTNTGPTVIIDKATHDKLTKLLRTRMPYGFKYSSTQVWKHYEFVYKGYPDWLDHIRPIFHSFM